MALEGEQEGTPLSTKPIPSPKGEVPLISQESICQPDQHDTSSAKQTIINPKDFIISVARKLSSQPLQISEPNVWGVLTAISTTARKRPQGMNILLTADEHRIGRLVEDMCFRVEANAVSGNHCKIYRKRITTEDMEQESSFSTSVFLKDTSTNGTYLNWEKLTKTSTEAKLQHGDIVSLAAAPQHNLAIAFVYREVLNSVSSKDGATIKRKADEFVSESKRLKGIGIGAPEGPITLSDVRSLQRSNMELRKQLESHVLSIETMQNENRAAVARHENEMKELKESISQSFLDEIKELRCTLEVKEKELVEVSTISTERQQAIEDLNRRLSASMQSRIDADEIIDGQKGTISELERQLDEERTQRREEGKKALADQKAALQRAQSEAQEELKRQSDIASRQERELKEAINKLQESDKESRLLVEDLRSKLDSSRECLFISEKKVRLLEAQIQEELQVSANGRKKVEALECEMKRLRKKLEEEKVAREEAWAKVSALELEMAAALRDLSMEKQRFQGARERIILRESQLRAFYSTTEEISSLFVKQQEQLRAMQRTLEDEENNENTSVDIDLHTTNRNTTEASVREKEMMAHRSNNNVKDSSATSNPKIDRIQVESTSDEASDTEKHDCDLRSQEDDHHTQDMEYTSADHSVKVGFGSDIDGVGTAPVLEGDPVGTERVLGTESPAIDVYFRERNIDLNKTSALAGDTMQVDDETQIQENGHIERVHEESARCSQSNNPLDISKAMEDTDGTIRTADLLTSEVVGSWAISTAPSVHGENESPTSDDKAANAQLCVSEGRATGSQIAHTADTANKLRQERLALNEMIKIVAPDLEEQFGDGSLSKGGDDDEASISDSDTEGSNHDDGDANVVDAEDGSTSDADTQAGSDQGVDDNEVDVAMDESDDARQEDSLG